MNNQEKPFYKSKKFWYAVAIGIAATVKEMGLDIPAEALYAGIALILGQGLADLSKNAQKAPEIAPVSEKPTQITPQPQSHSVSPPVEATAPFSPVEFDKAVTHRAKEVYGKATESHKFAAAKDLGMTARVSHIDQAVDYWSYLLHLADNAFTEVWGYNISEAQTRVSDPGTPKVQAACGGWTNLKNKATALGPASYGSYLDLERTKTTLSELEAVKTKCVDWKVRLYPQHHTLYHLGEMAKYLL